MPCAEFPLLAQGETWAIHRAALGGAGKPRGAFVFGMLGSPHPKHPSWLLPGTWATLQPRCWDEAGLNP